MRQELGHVTSEREYFYQRDVELIEKMRRDAYHEQRLQRLGDTCHIDDPNILESLERLGFTPTTVSLLCLVPVVQVAWARGWASHAERKRVLVIARRHRVEENTPAYQQLEAWLSSPPPAEFFQGILRAIQASLALLPQSDRKARLDALMQDCREVAWAVRWRLGKVGTPERELLEEIEKQLEPHKQLAASAGV